MIKMLRIDDRLLHGQVAFVWKNHLGISRIIVANDDLMKDPVQQLAMKMVVPDDVKLLMKGVEAAKDIINDPRSQGVNILLVVRDPMDAAAIVKGMNDPSQIETLNIGNSGRVHKQNKSVLTKEVYVDQNDIHALQELLSYNIPFHIQMVPTSSRVDVSEALRKFKKEE